MSTEARSPAKKDVTSATKSPENKGKGKEKAVDRSVKEEEEEEEEEDEEDEEDEEEEGDEMEEEDEDIVEIDPRAILPRRTRGTRVDYTSKEALEKAGLTQEDQDSDDDERMEH